MGGQDLSYDVLVIGAGAAGLSAAITAQHYGCSVLVVEKEDKFGGTTARSGGWLWVPGNPLAAREGAKDTLQRARAYIEHEAGNHFSPHRVDAFLRNAGPMVEFFEKYTQVKFVFGKNYPDYHPDRPGGAEEGRSIHPIPFDGTLLGDKLNMLATPMPESTFMGMGLNSGPDLKHFLNATRSVRSALFVAARILSHGRDVLLHGRGARLVNGNALAARLLATALEKRIPLWSSAKAIELVSVDGRVAGAVVEVGGKQVRVTARKGVVLAAGGFPQNEARRKAHYDHLRNGGSHASLAPFGNTGDGVEMAEKLSAAMVEDFPNAAAWAPVSLIKREDGSVGRFFHLIDRAKPGVIAVTPEGRRFTNESENYHDFVRAMIDACAGKRDVSAYMVCDHRAIRRYGLGAVRPSPLPLGPHLKSGYLVRANTIEELAKKTGMNPAVLAQTIAAVNRDAAQGVDREFGKGSTSYQRLLGDTDFQPNPCLAPLKQAPFYAVKIIPGDLGTYHGLKTDAQTRVLSIDGRPIAGLYAVGNDAASIFGGSYPGAGATLGPAMTFGFICGTVVAQTAATPSAPAQRTH